MMAMMKIKLSALRFPLRLFCWATLLCSAPAAWGQNDFYIDGANVYVQSGGLIHVNGEVINDDQGANIGRMFNSGTIQLTGNWSNISGTSNVFQALDPGTSVFLGSSAVQTIGGTRDTYFNNLTISKPGGTLELRMLRNCVNDGVLNLTDDFLNTQTFTHLVSNANPAAIVRSGPIVANYSNSTNLGYVTSTSGSAGRLSRATSTAYPGGVYLFPVGTSTRFRPVEITTTSVGNNVDSVQCVNLPTPRTNLRAATLATINPAWYHFIERSVAAGSPENIRIYHDFTADNVCDISRVTISEWNLALWADLGTTTSTQNASPTLSWTQKSGYPAGFPTPWVSNSFALAGVFVSPGVSSCVFPVELVALRADPLERSILVSWIAETQTANSGWFVERSENGLDFQHLGWVNGAGTTTTRMNYDFEDKDVKPGVLYYYRLRQLDITGAENLSEVVTAILPEGGMSMGDLYPNPTAGVVYLPIAVDQAAVLKVDIVNMLGQSVLSSDYLLNAGYQEVMIQMGELAQGVYQVNLMVGGKSVSKKLVLQ